ncbi:GNAT superfamily N-acetyltransferase [Caulobacter ginsengisoli]|uniref:GNAT superfamily N-acetyltransferase n=1 Tax=Caulobacter ginsengisoli TaxID=400775 RepID=A0ABU0IRJ5_9CAUL|nr:polysaccharide pyruvyl transferase family protein [Caulobacter ginsengisoli]MDQ0464635.1 GNAT superfamily N-acetyltransferase [Caulobacter ginsengisoli]
MSGRAAIPIVVINDTRVDRHHGCGRVMRTLLDLASANELEVIATAPAHADWRADPAFMAAFERARLVIVNGEGTIHHDRPAGALLLEAGAAARARGIPAALINASWQTNPAASLAEFALIAARETRSVDEIAEAGFRARRVPDLSLYETVTPAPRRQGVGFTDSVVRSLVPALESARRRVRGVPVPIQYGGGRLAWVRQTLGRQDLLHPARLVALAGARLASYGARSADDAAYMDRIAGLEMLVTGRFHAATFALAAGTPLLALDSNTHKIAAVLEDAGLDPARLIGPTELAALRPVPVPWSAAEQANLADYLADGQRATAALFADLAVLAA